MSAPPSYEKSQAAYPGDGGDGGCNGGDGGCNGDGVGGRILETEVFI